MNPTRVLADRRHLRAFVAGCVAAYGLLPDPLHVRGRATGWVAACTKAGSLAAQALGVLGLVPGLARASARALAPIVIAMVLVMRHCAETRGRDLREMEEPA